MRTFVGFGFGPIQGGLFLREAHRSGCFDRLVVAEVMPEVVDAIRASDGKYVVNVATADGVLQDQIEGVEIYNPTDAEDREKLVSAVAEASEIATALPSVSIYDKGTPSVAGVLAQGAARNPDIRSVVYVGENDNHAAEILKRAVVAEVVGDCDSLDGRMQFLNTVIGKMSGVVTDTVQIEETGLAVLTEGGELAFLVEEFNRILISKIQHPSFDRGIGAFIEKDDLLPFEEAKLYGHNATHALVGYLANARGCEYMSDVIADTELVEFARRAFLDESGRGLIARYSGVDDLFTPEGYRKYAEDLLVRMMNPHLRDRVERIIRDSHRKLSWNDRLVGTMRIVLDADVVPERFAAAAAAALDVLCKEEGSNREDILAGLWDAPDEPPGRQARLMDLIRNA